MLGLAADVRRLAPPDHREPEAFHIAKSGIADELRRAVSVPASYAHRPMRY